MSNDKHKAAIDALVAYRDELLTEIERLTVALKAKADKAQAMILELQGTPGEQLLLASDAPATVSDYSNLGPQAAVERFLRENPGQSFRSGIIANRLQERGFVVSNPPLLRQQITIALRRAVNKGLAVEETSPVGRMVFRLNSNRKVDMP